MIHEKTERERQPYVQIDSNLWAVMRYSTEHPAAMILGIGAQVGGPRYLVLTWDPVSAKRKLISMHTTLQEANQSVLWEPEHPPNPEHLRDRAEFAKYPQMGYPKRSPAN